VTGWRCASGSALRISRMTGQIRSRWIDTQPPERRATDQHTKQHRIAWRQCQLDRPLIIAHAQWRFDDKTPLLVTAGIAHVALVDHRRRTPDFDIAIMLQRMHAELHHARTMLRARLDGERMQRRGTGASIDLG